MADQYDPPESKIDEVISKTGGDPRKLAVAYLRAQKRARDAELGFRMMDDIAGATLDAATGNMKGASKSLDRAKRRMAQHKDISEST